MILQYRSSRIEWLCTENHVKERQVKCHYAYLRNWDFAQLGSPTMQTLMSPLRLMPSWVNLWTPPISIRRTARFISWWPKTVGQMLSTILLKKSGVFRILITSSSSSGCHRTRNESVKSSRYTMQVKKQRK